MDKVDRKFKQETIDKIDALTQSPSDRATKIYNILIEHDISNWDVICFCTEFLALTSESMPWIQGSISKIAKLVYTQHYILHDSEFTKVMKEKKI